MKKGGCPICDFVEFRLHQALERFLDEGINTPHTRAKIEWTNGFCNYHAHRLLTLGDPLSHAILYHDFINNVMKDVPDKHSKTDRSAHKECFFCNIQKSNDDDYTKAFLEFYDNRDFEAQYEENGILCVPHLVAIQHIRFSNKKTVKRIVDTTMEKYKNLNHHLSEIKRKSDYRNTHEKWSEEEKDAWKKAVHIFNSYPGIRP
ncbi:MAG: hypothetical protein J6K51_07365 [Clostridia bacterium]|nr:hypothetical protein [Clostridia bacterium]